MKSSHLSSYLLLDSSEFGYVPRKPRAGKFSDCIFSCTHTPMSLLALPLPRLHFWWATHIAYPAGTWSVVILCATSFSEGAVRG